MRHGSTARTAAALAGCAGLAISAPGFSHHTYAMFDGAKQLTLQGTVKELQWTNPHCFLQLLVAKDGQIQEWSLQMNAPVDLYRNGWRPHSLKVGDKIKVTIHPARDGHNSGSYVSGTGPDGEKLSPD